MVLLRGKMDINIWEVIEAAKTKPFGFPSFFPGPGIGAHCIPLDPFYLEHNAKNYQFDLTMINTTGHINNLMPHRMAIKITSALNTQKKSVNYSKSLFLGAAYKADIDDTRESQALPIIDEMCKKGGEVVVHEPYRERINTEEGRNFHSIQLTEMLLSEGDCVVITTAQTCLDIANIFKHGKLVVDFRNAVKQKNDRVFKFLIK